MSTDSVRYSLGILSNNKLCTNLFNQLYVQLRWLNTVFKKMENSRFRCVFLDNYYLLINKKYFTYIKQHLKSLNFCTKVTQLPLLWQQ